MRKALREPAVWSVRHPIYSINFTEGIHSGGGSGVSLSDVVDFRRLRPSIRVGLRGVRDNDYAALFLATLPS